VKVKVKYINELRQVTGEIMEELNRIDGVYNVMQNFGEGKNEMKIYVD